MKCGIKEGKPELLKLREEIPEILRIGGVAAEPVEEQFEALNIQLENCELSLDELDNVTDEQLCTAQTFNDACHALEEWMPVAFNSPAITEAVSFEADDLFRQINDIKVSFLFIIYHGLNVHYLSWIKCSLSIMD